jgi:transposase
VDKIIGIGVDTSKSVFQLHGVDEAEKPVLRRKMTRDQMITFFSKLPPAVVGLEACGASHYWARRLQALGHEVRLIPPQRVKPYVPAGKKNDAADAESICEAMSRPRMRFVKVKTADQQADLMLQSTRSLLVRQQTQLSNAIRGHGAELGIVAAKGLGKVDGLLQRIAQDRTLPENARASFGLLGEQFAEVGKRITAIDARLRAWHRGNERSKRLAAIPGVGQRIATTLTMKVPDPHIFRSGRHFGSWVGFTPKDHSTAGKQRLGGITRAGDEELRSLLVVGATAVIQQVRKGRGPQWPWLVDLVKRKEPKRAAVALANKMARIAWKMMVSGASYRVDHRSLPPTAQAA